MPGVSGIGDWRWHEATRHWALPVRLVVETPNEFLPKETAWYVLVCEPYPWGAIAIHPDAEDGISATFSHQTANTVVRGQAWRAGEICVAEQVAVLGRWGGSREPYDEEERLAWRVRRAIRWLADAAAGTLARPGDPFELPHFPVEDAMHVVTQSEALERGELEVVSGLAEVSIIPPTRLVFVRALRPGDGVPCRSYDWGSRFSGPGVTESALWLRLESVPVLPPWQAPITFGELRACLRARAVDLDALVTRFARRLEGDLPRVVLVGFPVPEFVGGEGKLLRWQSFLFPPIPRRKYPKVNGRSGSLRRALPLPSDDATVCWVKTEDWSDQFLKARGTLTAEVAARHVVLIGAGSLGSTVADQLVRGGVRRLTIVDPEILEGVNVARHILTLTDAGKPKAEALAHHLRGISPHARIDAVVGEYPEGVEDELLTGSTVVVETTGKDEVLANLARRSSDEPCHVVSLSVNYGARRLFCFLSFGRAFPHRRFCEMIRPWLDEDTGVIDASRRDGAGCFHPSWPGRFDAVAGLVSAAVPIVEGWLTRSGARADELVVFERTSTGEIARLQTDGDSAA